MNWRSLKRELFTYFFITSTVILIFLGIILYSVMDRTIYERIQKDQKLFLENQLQLVDSNLSLLENLIQIECEKNRKYLQNHFKIT